MDSKNRKNLDVKYLHPFSPSPSHNGHRQNSGAEGLFPPDYFDAADSAFKKIKLLQESSLDHHPTSVSCPTPARRRHRTTFTQVNLGRKKYLTIRNQGKQIASMTARIHEWDQIRPKRKRQEKI